MVHPAGQVIFSLTECKPRGGYSPKIPIVIRVCAAQRGRDFGTPDLERGIHIRDFSKFTKFLERGIKRALKIGLFLKRGIILNANYF